MQTTLGSFSKGRLEKYSNLPLTSAVLVGLGIALGVAFLVGVVLFIPDQSYAYPLVLLPLIAVGPLASQSARNVRRAALAGLIAGVVSAIGAAFFLYLAASVLNDFRFTFLAPATKPPVPPVPQIQVIPFLSWPLHYLLILQPIVAALLASFYWTIFNPSARFSLVLERGAAAIPASVRLKLAVLLLIHAGLTALVGWVSFSVIEDMHLRGHAFQLQLDWQGHAGELARHVDAEDRAIQLMATDPAKGMAELNQARQNFASVVQHLRTSPPHPFQVIDQSSMPPANASTDDKPMVVGLSVGRASQIEVANRYREYVDRLAVAEEDLGKAAVPTTVSANRAEADRLLFQLRQALHRLEERVDRDAVEEMNRTDLAHHANLFAIIGLVILTIGSGIVLGGVAARAITRPIGVVSGRLTQLASGDFKGKIWVANRDELGSLVGRVNEVTAELDRLYRQEQDAREAAEELARRERVLSETKEFLAHTIVHDLKQPLVGIVGYAHLLNDGLLGPLEERQKRAIADLLDQTNRLEGMASDIVDVFRLEHDGFPLDLSEERPWALVDFARANVTSPMVKVPEICVPDNLPVVRVDRRLVVRVLGNLIANCYQHAGDNVTIRVGAERQGREMVFWVEDDGPGISGDDSVRIFDRFKQGPSARSGSGLGLAFCKAAVERHGGRIWVDRSTIGGARFSFTVGAVSASIPVAS